MNYVDNNFYWLIDRINNKTKEELFNHIKDKYMNLPKETKLAIEKFLNDYDYWGKLSYQDNIFEEIENKVDTFYNHLEALTFLYENLNDYRSKKLLFSILYNWYDYDFENLKSLMDNTYCHYFDLDILPCQNEVFVDVGAYIGDTTLDFINSYGNYNKIYCYEMTKDSFNILKNNLKEYSNIILKNKAVSDKEEILHMNYNSKSLSANALSIEGEKVKATSLDKDIKEKITLIKMDIEGSEYKALIGAKEHIVKEHPKLLISVYHNHYDIWKIPKMIKEICPSYKFYLRYYGNYLFPTEIVLFAV